MATYSAEPVPSLEVYEMLDEHWDQKTNGEIPKPRIFDVNGENRELRINLQEGITPTIGGQPVIVIRADIPTLEEMPIGNWIYGNRITKVLLELHTMRSRQNLYDMMQEVRRIVHARRHYLVNYQRIKFDSFNETTNEQLNYWSGRVLVTLESNAVLLET